MIIYIIKSLFVNMPHRYEFVSKFILLNNAVVCAFVNYVSSLSIQFFKVSNPSIADCTVSRGSFRFSSVLSPQLQYPAYSEHGAHIASGYQFSVPFLKQKQVLFSCIFIYWNNMHFHFAKSPIQRFGRFSTVAVLFNFYSNDKL